MSKEIKVSIKIPSLNLKNYNFWKYLALIFSILFLASFYFNVTGFYLRTNETIASYPSKEKIMKDTIEFINQYLIQPGAKAEGLNITDKGTYYEIMTIYQGNYIPVYVSKDGKVLFLQGIDMDEFKKTAIETQQTSQTQKDIPKKEKPEFKVFIMSYCPFGIQAVKALLPVMKLLGDKADISIHFVNYIMHGEKEVWENLRQYCIQKEQKDKFYDYMLCFVQSGDYEKCIKEANVDVEKLDYCISSLDKKYNITEILKDKSTWLNGVYPPFPIEDELNAKYKVRGSPTIIINDVEVRLSRSPEEFKKAICNAFVNPPKECEEKLSTEIASPGIGPLTGGTNTQASCG
ncbi:MAG: hypothetical protein QXW01_02785 [Candidatus Aenigmatarchaeota archaeon]